jgi:hypothetical protein
MATRAIIDAPYSSTVAKVDLVPDMEAKWFARGEHRNVLRFRIRHVFRRQREQAAEGEEHHHRDHQHTGTGDNLRTFALGKIAAKSFSYSSRLETTNEETIGEKLKEKTMMEIPSHTVTRMPSCPVKAISLRFT